ncbi:pentapeptide repeat-containing protein [Actinoplanes sp. NPDC051494]|uniref:pentapeptide repeat-containing protein n=1 Tax=Actinoplanes sp. NPDC051494 TaxID=3363907 RepID=UPI00378D85D7
MAGCFRTGLVRCALTRARLLGSRLTGSCLTGSRLTGSCLTGSCLTGSWADHGPARALFRLSWPLHPAGAPDRSARSAAADLRDLTGVADDSGRRSGHGSGPAREGGGAHAFSPRHDRYGRGSPHRRTRGSLTRPDRAGRMRTGLGTCLSAGLTAAGRTTAGLTAAGLTAAGLTAAGRVGATVAATRLDLRDPAGARRVLAGRGRDRTARAAGRPRGATAHRRCCSAVTSGATCRTGQRAALFRVAGCGAAAAGLLGVALAGFLVPGGPGQRAGFLAGVAGGTTGGAVVTALVAGGTTGRGDRPAGHGLVRGCAVPATRRVTDSGDLRSVARCGYARGGPDGRVGTGLVAEGRVSAGRTADRRVRAGRTAEGRVGAGPARVGPVRIGSGRLGSGRFGSARVGSAAERSGIDLTTALTGYDGIRRGPAAGRFPCRPGLLARGPGCGTSGRGWPRRSTRTALRGTMGVAGSIGTVRGRATGAGHRTARASGDGLAARTGAPGGQAARGARDGRSGGAAAVEVAGDGYDTRGSAAGTAGDRWDSGARAVGDGRSARGGTTGDG